MTRTLFDDPPFVPHSPTSRAAAEAIEPRAETLRRKVLDWFRERGEVGGTDEEGVDETGIPPSTFRPRRIELVAAGLVRDSGRTRKTRSGRQAVVWTATENP